MVKAKISSKEAMNRLDLGSRVIELEVERKEDGTVIESAAILELSDEEFEKLKVTGKNAGYKVTKA